jgi:apyrase
VNPNAAIAKVKPSDFEEAARCVCKLNMKEAQTTYPDVSEETIPYLCIDLVYQYTLLVDGFGMA